jgi:hypothetical protein
MFPCICICWAEAKEDNAETVKLLVFGKVFETGSVLDAAKTALFSETISL